MFDSLGISRMWEETLGDPRIRIAIIDGSVDVTHPSLVGARLVNRDTWSASAGRAEGGSHHGTHIASIIFGQPGSVVRGIAPHCEGIILPIFADAKDGELLPCSQLELALALNQAVASDAHVINLSISELSVTGTAEPSLAMAVRRCIEAGILLVVAAGNHGCECLTIPGALPAVLAVGATDWLGNPLASSNWGMAYEHQGIVAPGKDIVGAAGGGGTRLSTGTSCATAIVSGVAALLLSLQLKRNQKPDANLVRSALLASAIRRPGDSPRVLAGRLDVRGAVALAIKGHDDSTAERPPFALMLASSQSVAEYATPAVEDTLVPATSHRPYDGPYVPALSALKDLYARVAREKFGTVEIQLSGGAGYNVQDLHYFVGDRPRGMHVIPVCDDGDILTANGSRVAGYRLIDDFLRHEMDLDDVDPIYALISYIRPDEHALPLKRLPQTLKAQLGHQHLGAYLGQGCTTNALPPAARETWPKKGRYDAFNVSGRPANVHCVSLRGTPQRVLNRNARLVDTLLAANVLVPVNTQNTRCRAIDLNTTLQFYRDWIRQAEYLSDFDWYTNCANHKTIVINVMLNLPHNPARFEQIFGDDGRQLWQEFRQRYRRLNDREFAVGDETEFEPLWQLEGLPVESVRPLRLAEHNAFRVAVREGRLDGFRGPKPLEPGRGLAWPLETVADVVAGFMGMYVSFVDVGCIVPASMLLAIKDKVVGVSGISDAHYHALVAPAVETYLTADALLNAEADERWQLQTKNALLAGLGDDAALMKEVDRCLAVAAKTANEIGKDKRLTIFEVAQWLNQSLAGTLQQVRLKTVEIGDRAGFFSSPAILQRIALRMYSKSPFVTIRTVATLMAHDEVEFADSAITNIRVAQLSPIIEPTHSLPVAHSNSSSGAVAMNQLDRDETGSQHLPSSIPAAQGAINPSSAAQGTCNCGAATGPPRLVYALGKLNYDLVSQSRSDSLKQKMSESHNPENPDHFLAYLHENAWDATAVQWTLTIDSTPIYVIRPQGPFARETYDQLRQFMGEQLTDGVERISVAGVITDTARLRNGLLVPAVAPESRGMYNWTTDALLEALASQSSPESPQGPAQPEEVRSAVRNFLDRVYYQLRNTGLAPQERAINFAATNAFDINNIFKEAIREQMALDGIEVERSPISRPGADCWDVKLLFFFPQRQVQTVRKVYRFTVDVSDVVPVTVGTVHSWFIR